MSITMIVDRTDNWFVFDDIEGDPYYQAIQILEQLISKPKLGLKYSRINILKILKNEQSIDAIKILDKAIILLCSRSLIKIEAKSNYNAVLLITNKGVEALAQFRKELKEWT
ncbi:hypothetical protein N0U24_11240 [Peribacillus frigoritolerans]|uniref:hypothetical protein n=1 Tax=Peribacillus frigoritolerans TaxID=450367 RepID=UPI0021A99228|nr:hypothetical protein [Peribacillus frigoritolerans]MCT4477727.1 hypothetical protein [Peribacillus frigoritolerans]